MGEGARRGVGSGLDRVTIQEAARRFGVSEGAVRKRVTRGTLEHDKEDDGRVYVYLDERDTRGVDDVQDTGVHPVSSALISRLEGEVEFLRDQVRRQQEIIAQQAVTMRQLTAAAQEEPTEDAQTVEEEPERAEPRPGAPGAQEGAQRPWWRRMFGRA
jgi:uncharacterized membrane protein